MTVKAVDDLGSVHLVGIGGAGMSALARVLAASGSSVSGSDIKESRVLYALRALGMRTAVGHRAENIEGATTVVVSSAIPPANPEVTAARSLGVPILQRAQVLAMLMRTRKGIAVAGTHGKTTTTSMIATALTHAGLDPTFLIGGDLNETGSGAHYGQGEWLVAEADESDGSLLWLGPEIAVVTNIEADHLDYYKDEAEIRQTFLAFLANVRPSGLAVVCSDDTGAASILRAAPCRVETYGLGSDASWRAEVLVRDRAGQRARVFHSGEPVGELSLGVAGNHNLRNGLAAVAVAHHAGVAFEVVTEELASFGGVARRFEVRGAAAGVTVVDDYAHHPTEIRATLAAARERGWDRLVAVFQPHRYTRTQAMGVELGAALSAADVAVVTDVYGAGEDPIPGVSGKRVLDGVVATSALTRAAYIPARKDVAAYVAERARSGDLVLTIGAGDVTMLAEEILLRLVARARRSQS